MYWGTLKDKGFIQGISTNEHGRTQANMALNAPKHVTYPWEIQLIIELDGEPDVNYLYLINIPSADSDLLLTRISKTDAKGKLLADNLPLPSSKQQRIANEELRNCDDLKKLHPGK